MDVSAYRTVAAAAVDEFTEKRSRFIGAVCPVATEEEAQAFIRARKKEFWDARHNVYVKKDMCTLISLLSLLIE